MLPAGLKLIAAALTVPDRSLMRMVPPIPPLPMAATSPFTQPKSKAPSDQLALVVLQVPEPSCGVVGLAPLASQVRVCPKAEPAHRATAQGRTVIHFALRGRISRSSK